MPRLMDVFLATTKLYFVPVSWTTLFSFILFFLRSQPSFAMGAVRGRLFGGWMMHGGGSALSRVLWPLVRF